jgi:hypothetical protein
MEYCFLKVNEAVYCKDNPITLLSKYQIREYGLSLTLLPRNIENHPPKWALNVLYCQSIFMSLLMTGEAKWDSKFFPSSQLTSTMVTLYDMFEITGAAIELWLVMIPNIQGLNTFPLSMHT